MSYGMVGALQFEVLMSIVGTEKFSSAIGLVLLVEAIAVLVGPPGAGQNTNSHMYFFLKTYGIESIFVFFLKSSVLAS